MFTIAIGLLCVFIVILYARLRLVNNPPLPPGPPAEPILGHMRMIPQTEQDMYFYELGKKYGDVVHLKVLGRSMIIINSLKAATELLDKKNAIYSDRPDFPIFELMGWKPTVTFLHYGEQFRQQRRMLQQYLSKTECIKYGSYQTKQARVLVNNLITNPDGRNGHLSRFATAIVIWIVSGHEVTSDDDMYIRLAEEVGSTASNSGPPGSTPVDFFPFLKYLPSWIPGTYYAQFARSCRPVVRRLHDLPYQDVMSKMSAGAAVPSFLRRQLEDAANSNTKTRASLDDILGAAGSIYIGGADTTSSSMSIFLLAMVLHPGYQRKAQEEIDRIIGNDRLPELSDRESLSYVECVLQEALRWHHAAPVGVPHRSTEDDVYNGMWIPKGSVVIANIRGMSLDENVYANPFEYNPDRYLPKPHGNAEPYPLATFGFGRRVCPGRYLADASLWIAAATILATVSITKVVGDDGMEITPDASFETGIASHPRPYRCDIQPRTKTAHSLIKHAIGLDD